MHFLANVQNWIAFGPRWPNFGPLVAKTMTENGPKFCDHYLKKYWYNPIQTCGLHLLGACSEWIRFSATLVPFRPSSGQKATENVSNCLFPTIIRKVFTQSNSNFLVCTLSGWVFRTDLFWVTLANFWPSSGHKMTENGGFRPISEKVFMQSNCTLIVWVFGIDLLLVLVGQILGL